MDRSGLRAPIGIGLVALAMALGGCEDLDRMLGIGGDDSAALSNTGTSNTTSSASTAGPKPTAAPAAAADPQLAGQIAAAVTELNGRTPMQVDQITTLTGVRSNGTEIIYEMAISQPIPGGQAEQLRQIAQTNNQANLCRDVNAGRLIRMGGSMTHNYTDSAGITFQTRVVSCPPA